VPKPLFDQLVKHWISDLPNLVCQANLTFCHIKEPCQSVMNKLKPIGFQLSDYVFELNPEEYL